MFETRKTRYGAVIALLMAVAWLTLPSASAPDLSFLEVGQPPADRPLRSLRDMSDAMVEIAENANPSVVTVFTERTLRVRQRDPFADFFGFGFGFPGSPGREQEYRQSGQGSGVIVSADGYLITNHHVIDGADSVRIRTLDNRTWPAKVVGSDPSTDVAVLKVDAPQGFTPVVMGDSDELKVGAWVLAIGSPLDENLAHTVTMGIVSARGRSNVKILEFEDFIQTDAAINPGNSGGALLDLDGRLVGINTAIATRTGGFQGIGFAIPVNMVRNIMRSIIEHGKVVRPYVGIQMQDVSETMARGLGLEFAKGVLVAQVVEGSPAEKAGLKEGDVVVEVDGRAVSNLRQIRGYVAGKAPGDRVRLSYLREGRSMNATLVLAEMPQDGSLAAVNDASWNRLGFSLAELDRAKREALRTPASVQGVLVSGVDEQSPAFEAGLRNDDVLVAVNRRAVRNPAEAAEAIGRIPDGEVALLQIVRGRQSYFVAFEVR